MFDAAIRPLMNKPLEIAARQAIAFGISANAATAMGFVVGIGAAGLIAAKLYWVGLGVILLSRFFDGLDGAIARQTKLTDVGGFLDITLDFIFYASAVFAFALAEPRDTGGGT